MPTTSMKMCIRDRLGAGSVVGMLIPDIIMKMVMKRDITAMDDYVKSRPVPEKIWNKFLLTTNPVSYTHLADPRSERPSASEG